MRFAPGISRRLAISARLEREPAYRRKLAAAIASPTERRIYEDWLARGLMFLDQHMGRPQSFRAFRVSLSLALGYCYLFFLISWAVLNTPGALAGIELLPQTWAQEFRLVLISAIFLLVVLLLYMAGRTTAAFDRKDWRWALCSLGIVLAIGLMFEITTTVAGWFTALLMIMCAVAVGFLGGLFGTGAMLPIMATFGFGSMVWSYLGSTFLHDDHLDDPFVSMVIFSFFMCLMAASAIDMIMARPAAANRVEAETRSMTRSIARGESGLIAVHIVMATIIISFAGLDTPNLDTTVAVVVMIFLFALPVVNAVWDWLSWWLSRALAERLLFRIKDCRRSVTSKIFIFVTLAFVDLIAALVMVVCLAYTLPQSAYYLSNLLSSEAALSVVEINDYLCEAARDPWGFGSWAMLMLATTLLPTAWHAVASVAAPAALVAMRVGVSRDVVVSLESERPTSDAIGIAATYVALWRPLIWLLAGCLVLGALLALAQLLRWAGEPLPKLLLLAASGFDVGRVDVCLGSAGAF